MTKNEILETNEIRVEMPVKISDASSQPMIQSLHIENFRCFQKLDLKDFGRFNIIVGDNGSGKTALLEAIFLPGNSAQVPMVFRSLRGMVIPPAFSPEKETYESMFNDLFFGFSTELRVEIDLKGSYDNLRKAKISFDPISETPLFPEGESKTSKTANKLFTLQTTDADNHESVQKINLNGNLNVGGSHKASNITFSTSAGVPNPLETAQIFSNLEKNDAKAYQLVLETISILFPRISDISVGLSGGVGELYCKVEGSSKKMPLSLASNGFNKIFYNLLQISAHSNGIALIDEIENGIYYKRLPKVWESIIQFCHRFDTQLFVSTHSKECLEALAPQMGKNEKEFRLIRTEGENGAGHTARIFKGENSFAALETGTEIR